MQNNRDEGTLMPRWFDEGFGLPLFVGGVILLLGGVIGFGPALVMGMIAAVFN
jgi:hypothetical protein